MSYGDARYQTKRISIENLKRSSGAPSDAPRPAQPVEGNDSCDFTPPLPAGPIPAKAITPNPYAASRKIRTFTAPIPDTDPLPPAPDFAYVTPEAAPEATSTHHVGASRIYELAEKYVSVFQTHAAAQMTPEQRRALVAEVATFYSAPFRAGRLEALVGVFDG